MAGSTIKLDIDTGSPNIWARYLLTPTRSGFEARGYVFGVQDDALMLQKVMEKLSIQAQQLHKPITHCYVASHRKAVALIERTPGYVFTGITEQGHREYQKVFQS